MDESLYNRCIRYIELLDSDDKEMKLLALMMIISDRNFTDVLKADYTSDLDIEFNCLTTQAYNALNTIKKSHVLNFPEYLNRKVYTLYVCSFAVKRYIQRIIVQYKLCNNLL